MDAQVRDRTAAPRDGMDSTSPVVSVADDNPALVNRARQRAAGIIERWQDSRRAAIPASSQHVDAVGGFAISNDDGRFVHPEWGAEATALAQIGDRVRRGSGGRDWRGDRNS